MKGGTALNILQYKLNAIMAKSRAVYGKRLTGKDYESLVNCSSVAEITSYLRSSTAYAEVLENKASTDISAGHLEFLIRKFGAETFERLYRYEVAFGQELYNYFVKNVEIEIILSKIRGILLGNSEDIVVSGSKLSREINEIDMYKVAKAENMEELASALDGTPYKAVIRKCMRDPLCDFLDYESAFSNYFHEYEYELIKKCYGRNNDLLKLLSQKADTEFIDKAYRTKKFFNASSDRILRNTAPVHLTDFSQKQISGLINASDENAVLSVLERTKYKEYARKIREADYAEQAIAQLNYKKYKHLLRFSRDPNEVMFCFMFLSENEISNLIHIIEGVKYKMDAESIKELLIGVGD